MPRLIRDLIPAGVFALLASEILLISTGYLLAEFAIATEDPWIFLTADFGWARLGLVVASIAISLHFLDLYSEIRVRSRILLLQQLCQVIGIALIVQGLVSYVAPGVVVPRWVMLLGSLFAMILLFSWRIFYANHLLRMMGGTSLLMVGASEVSVGIAEYVSDHPEKGVRILGFLLDGDARVGNVYGAPILGTVASLREVVQEQHPDRIVVGMSERRERMPVQGLLDLRFGGYAIEEATSAFETICGRVSTKDLRPAQFIFSAELGPTRRGLLSHGLLNYGLASLALLLFAPLMLLTAIAVRLTSPGPAFYRQRRVGLGGREFTIYKFRSMSADAESETGAIWARRNDPRVTKLGRWLRRLRIDELPQLFNVIRGEMAIVGPRPERPEFVSVLSERIPFYRQRHAVKPGITGWAQINYKYGESMEDSIAKLEYDLYYIKNVSLSLDLYIIFHTLKTIVLTRGAQ